jgi:hypothetical protein
MLPKYKRLLYKVSTAPIISGSDTETAMKDHENVKGHTQYKQFLC